MTLLDFRHELRSHKYAELIDSRLRFCPVSQASPLGIELKDGYPWNSKQPLDIICQSLIEGILHQLRLLVLDDGALLRVKKLLPLFLGLDSVSCLRDGETAQHHWDWAVQSDPTPFAALRALRDRLSSSQNVQDVLDRCATILNEGWTKDRTSEVSVNARKVSQTLYGEDFAKWLLDDRRLAERAFLALEQRSKRGQVH